MKTRTRRASRRAGFALVWSLLTTMIVGTSIAVLWTSTRMQAQRVRTDVDVLQARYLALGSLAHAEDALGVALQRSDDLPTNLEFQLAGSTVTAEITALDPPVPMVDASGLQALVGTWRIEANAEAEGATSRLRRVVRGRIVPVFQYAWFYENDMALIHPAPMVVKGRVHCNSDVFIHTYWPLTFDTNHFRVAGNLYGRAKDMSWFDWAGGWNPQNPILFRRWVEDPFDPLEPAVFETLPTRDDLAAIGVSSIGGYDSDFHGWDADGDGTFTGEDDLLPFSYWAGEQWGPPAHYAGGTGQTVRTRDQGVQHVTVPGVESFDLYVPAEGAAATHVYDSALERHRPAVGGETPEFAPGPYHERASLTIVTHTNGTFKAYDEDGTDITSDLAGVVTLGSMYDARQAEGSGQSVKVATIDLAALTASGHFPPNGLLYAGGYGAGTGTDALGFRLKNGAELGGPLTVVSPNSLYVHGDYNTVAKKPAAVMADAVNLLSNAWTGNKTPGTLPVATNTTYNMALLSGERSLELGFNGGPMNLPRFHENWRYKDCIVTGSMASLFYSRYATSPFKNGGDVYQAPNRTWSYDKSFDKMENLPPFSPRFVEVEELVTM